MPKAKQNDNLHILIDRDVKERLKVAAKEDGRNLSNLVNKVLSDFVSSRKRGVYVQNDQK